MDSLKICTILPAAGCGTRMNSKHIKQFFPILNRPVLSYTISAFEDLEEVTSIIVVVTGDKWEELMNIIEKFEHKKVHAVLGSNSRHKSILNGLKMAETLFSDLDIIMVHDAVRPLVGKEDILTVARTAKRYGAAGITRPLVSTILELDGDGFMKKSLLRNNHVASETPQAFHFKLIQAAYGQCSQDEMDHGSECLHLLQEYAGIRVKLVGGSENLNKITYEKDIKSIEESIRNDQWKRPVTIFHEPIDYSVIELFEKSMPIANVNSTIISYHSNLVGKFSSQTGTFLFLKQLFHISVGTIESFSDCKKDCHKQLQSINFEESFIKNHVFDVFNLIHNLISKKSFIHKRMCLVFLYADHSTIPLVYATKLLNYLMLHNHGDECNVSINSVMFLKDRLAAEDLSQFFKDLHFMNPGACHFY